MDERAMRLELAEEDADAERLDELTGYLREELLHLDVDEVTAVRAGPPPPGARAFEVAVVGGLLVKLADPAVLSAVVSAVRAWLARGVGSSRTVRIEVDGDIIDLKSASREDQERLVALFVERHSSGSG